MRITDLLIEASQPKAWDALERIPAIRTLAHELNSLDAQAYNRFRRAINNRFGSTITPDVVDTIKNGIAQMLTGELERVRTAARAKTAQAHARQRDAFQRKVEKIEARNQRQDAREADPVAFLISEIYRERPQLELLFKKLDPSRQRVVKTAFTNAATGKKYLTTALLATFAESLSQALQTQKLSRLLIDSAKFQHRFDNLSPEAQSKIATAVDRFREQRPAASEADIVKTLKTLINQAK